ncbi:uncharacterized mitochondrial protein AtMg00810-like [Cornus florida]|uniref:uncharacterized mitochondrial protein AtMg00810-like n=1 Tax=Cornus florida TaxID=4283 RepID=UPI00289E77C5|nr:uncharacterized mitochondrial protein AtMg00810-like [Cornus florida]
MLSWYCYFGDGNASTVNGKDPSLMCFSVVIDEAILWHKRLGHVNYNDLVNLSNNDLVQGIQVKQLDDGIFISQSKYANELVKKFGMKDLKHVQTPMSASSKLDKDSDPNKVDHFLYRSMIGSLLYLAATRPDISFSVGVYARYQGDIREQHIFAVKRIIRYVNSTLNYGLYYSSESNSEIAGYIDAD